MNAPLFVAHAVTINIQSLYLKRDLSEMTTAIRSVIPERIYMPRGP